MWVGKWKKGIRWPVDILMNIGDWVWNLQNENCWGFHLQMPDSLILSTFTWPLLSLITVDWASMTFRHKETNNVRVLYKERSIVSLQLTLKGTLGVFWDPGGMKSLIFSKRFGCKCQYFRYSSLTPCLFKIINQFHMMSRGLAASCGYMSGVFKDPEVLVGDF